MPLEEASNSGDPTDEALSREVLRNLDQDPLPSDSGIIESAADTIRKAVRTVSAHKRFPGEKIERLRNLEPRFLQINEHSPETSPDLLQVDRLYSQNLVPDEAFVALEARDIFTFEQLVKRGGMLNRFEPNEQESEHYAPGYESVRRQIINDLLPDVQNPELARSGRPGKYYIRGLFEGDELRAYLSFRLPPHPSDFKKIEVYEEQLREYSAFLESTLFDEEMMASGQMQYEKKWNQNKTRQQFPSMWELDTYNVEGGWGGTAAILTRDVLQFVKQRYGELPHGMYCYRFKGLEYTDDESGQTIPKGENRASRSFLEEIGFCNMATRQAKADEVWRYLEHDHECHLYRPEWQFMYNGPNNIQKYLRAYMEERGLLEPGEPLLS